MYAISAARVVNPPDATVVLDRASVWRGLVMKAENALPFVAGMQHCAILDRFPGGLVREIVLRGVPMRERVLFTPEIEVRFLREATEYSGWIVNAVHDSSFGLLLSFSFALRFPGTEDGSPEERAAGDAVREAYFGAIDSTLAAIRRLAESVVLS
jgi:hypothetical protein